MANTLPTTMEYFDNLLGEQLTEGGGSGGGGSSDFSTAKVTFINNSQNSDFVVSAPFIFNNEKLFCDIYAGDMSGDSPYELVLYKGSLTVNLPDANIKIQSVTGDITIKQGTATTAVITGSGTISITDTIA